MPLRPAQLNAIARQRLRDLLPGAEFVKVRGEYQVWVIQAGAGPPWRTDVYGVGPTRQVALEETEKMLAGGA